MRRLLCKLGIHGPWQVTRDDPRGMGWQCLSCGERKEWLR